MVNRKRKNQIKFYVSDEELDLINQRAKKAGFGTDRSAYLRKICIDAFIFKLDLEPLRMLSYSIDKIGININQISRKINTENKIENNEITLLKDDMRILQKMILDIYDQYIKIKNPNYKKGKI